MDQTNNLAFLLLVLSVYLYRKNKKFEARIKALEQKQIGGK